MTRIALQDDFSQGLSSAWRRIACHGAGLQLTGETLRLVNTNASAQRYTNAQIDDYGGLPRRRFLWSPPLTLTVRARFSHPAARVRGDCDCDFQYQPTTEAGPILGGTAGFGFWNDPFVMTDRRPPALPRAIWFFYASPPSNMKLDLHTPGCGWKGSASSSLVVSAMADLICIDIYTGCQPLTALKRPLPCSLIRHEQVLLRRT